MSWHEDGHSVRLEAWDDTLTLKMQCPGEEFCEAKQRCHVCDGQGNYMNGPYETEPTYRRETCSCCGGTGNEPGMCHLMDWAQGMSALELHHGQTDDLYGVQFPAAIRWRYGSEDEGPEWRFAVEYPDEREEAKAA